MFFVRRAAETQALQASAPQAAPAAVMKKTAPLADLVAALKRKVVECLAVIKSLTGKVAALEKQIAEHVAAISALRAENASLKKEAAVLRGDLKKSEGIIAKLKARLKKDSSTSDKPPSTDAFKKPKPQSLRERSGKKPGGQHGHPGHTRELYPEPTRIIDIMPEPCACGCHEAELTGRFSARQEADITFNVEITEERAHEGICSHCGAVVRGSHSDGFGSLVHYGDNVKSLVALLSEHGFVSIAKTAEIISSLTGGAISLSWGTIANFQKELSAKLSDTIDAIRAALIASTFIGADETGCRVGGGLKWMQVFCNNDFALFGVHDKRGDIDGGFGILAYFVGILVHDHLSSYYNFKSLTHAECNQHILRALKGLAAAFCHSWFSEMSELLRSACHAKNELVRAGATCMPQETIDAFSEKYDAIIKKGQLEYEAAAAKDGEGGYVEERRLLARLSEFKNEHLLFLNDFDAPFSNNVSEQSIRFYKGKGKAIGCFRSFEGAQIYARIASLIVTLRKQGRNVYDGIRAVYSGGVPISTA